MGKLVVAFVLWWALVGCARHAKPCLPYVPGLDLPIDPRPWCNPPKDCRPDCLTPDNPLYDPCCNGLTQEVRR